MLPWLCNVQLTDIACNKTTANTRDSPEGEPVENTDVESALPHVEMTGDGWGSNKATQLILNNLFFLTVKVCLSIQLSYSLYVPVAPFLSKKLYFHGSKDLHDILLLLH